MFDSKARYINELSVNDNNAACWVFLFFVYGQLSFLMHLIELVKQRLRRVVFSKAPDWGGHFQNICYDI